MSVYMLLYVVERYDEVGYQSTKLLRYKNLSIFVSIAGILFSGGGIIGFVYMLFKCSILLAIEDHGMNINLLFSKSIFISWGDIKSIAKRKLGNHIFIEIELNDLGKFTNKQLFVKRKLIRANMVCGYPPITINLNSTKENVDDVILMMNYYLEEWRNTHKAIEDEKETFAGSVLNQNILE